MRAWLANSGRQCEARNSDADPISLTMVMTAFDPLRSLAALPDFEACAARPIAEPANEAHPKGHRLGEAAMGLLAVVGLFGQTLTWSYQHYPALAELVEALKKDQRQEAMYVENKEPVSYLQRFVIDGTSATDWKEAVEVVNVRKDKEARTPTDWYQRFQRQGNASCPSTWTLIAHDKISITFQRDSAACPPHVAQTGLYRVLYGKQDVFALIATYKGALPDEKRRIMLAMLASAALRK